MGASIGNAHGMEKALGPEGVGKVVAVIGDSTFLHSGVTGLMDIVYNKGCSTVILLDNSITAMTGAQENPSTGKTLHGDPTHRRDLPGLCRAIGVEDVYVMNPHDMELTQAVLRRELQTAMDGAGIDLWAAPATVGPAPRGLESTGDPVMNLPWTQAGFPALSLPCAVDGDGLPLGLQLVARFYDDERLLAWSTAAERVLGVPVHRAMAPAARGL